MGTTIREWLEDDSKVPRYQANQGHQGDLHRGGLNKRQAGIGTKQINILRKYSVAYGSKSGQAGGVVVPEACTVVQYVN